MRRIHHPKQMPSLFSNVCYFYGVRYQYLPPAVIASQKQRTIEQSSLSSENVVPPASYWRSSHTFGWLHSTTKRKHAWSRLISKVFDRVGAKVYSLNCSHLGPFQLSYREYQFFSASKPLSPDSTRFCPGCFLSTGVV